jgi:hypothetical protein
LPIEVTLSGIIIEDKLWHSLNTQSAIDVILFDNVTEVSLLQYAKA